MAFTSCLARLVLTASTAAIAWPATAQPGRGDAGRLVGRYWKAIELDGKSVQVSTLAREAHVVFEPAGRLSGADGCNRITGRYELKGDAVTFGPVGATQMACADTGAIERAFKEALKSATLLMTTGDRLELFAANGTRVAVFAAHTEAPRPSSPPQLEGTSWQLVTFTGADGTTLIPDERSKYTITFGAAARVTARIDCNRGRGTWTSSAPRQLALGPLAITRVACPPGSLHDQIVKQWGYVRSYVIENGHLFLSLMADGGTYELEPLQNSKP